MRVCAQPRKRLRPRTRQQNAVVSYTHIQIIIFLRAATARRTPPSASSHAVNIIQPWRAALQTKEVCRSFLGTAPHPTTSSRRSRAPSPPGGALGTLCALLTTCINDRKHTHTLTHKNMFATNCGWCCARASSQLSPRHQDPWRTIDGDGDDDVFAFSYGEFESVCMRVVCFFFVFGSKVHTHTLQFAASAVRAEQCFCVRTGADVCERRWHQQRAKVWWSAQEVAAQRDSCGSHKVRFWCAMVAKLPFARRALWWFDGQEPWMKCFAGPERCYWMRNTRFLESSKIFFFYLYSLAINTIICLCPSIGMFG